MGIDTGSALVVGLTGKDIMSQLPADSELRAKIEAQGLYEIMSEDGELGLGRVPPYYDADYDVCIWGVVIASDYWRPVELDTDTLLNKIDDAKAVFQQKTGLHAKVYVSAKVT